MTGMEQSIKELQKTMLDLQKAAERNNIPVGYTTPHSTGANFPLPNHRSQPSLPAFYDESGRDQMAHQQQMSGYPDTRRYPNNGYLNRTGYGGREGKDGGHPQFSNVNPYNNVSGQVGSGYVQGYPPYGGFSPNQDQQHYGYNQGQGPAK
ncbi:hypothetical protein K458DRAFT_423302 [Lentithecium fluviatile CBS 122367]|uniref:Uncharacterized protein n=1 Tax=Lentithecium fluviatile CBS 122367 TaxID=1168545 RepID=A0A6G1IJF9_9PLEO|nr:hypothetical protein K458DRAFT_423302 [Lentithecium fluviatile CBS 122367]